MANITGTEGSDSILTTGVSMGVTGGVPGAGSDIVNGLGGNDTIAAGKGDDDLGGGEGNDTLYGEAGNDTLVGGAGENSLDGGDGHDFFHVHDLEGASRNMVQGGAGADYILIQRIFGTAGTDVLDGGAGNDYVSLLLVYGTTTDLTFEFAGAKAVTTVEGNGTTLTGIENIEIAGGTGNDRFETGGGEDNLLGGFGDDTLSGGGGHDDIYGGYGLDRLEGGGGSDTFYFTLGQGADRVQDFVHGVDLIGVDSGSFGFDAEYGAPLAAERFALNKPTEEFGQFVYKTGNGKLFWDPDGTGDDEAALIAVFRTVPSLSAADFITSIG